MTIAFKCTPEDARALAALAERRAAKGRAAGFDVDATVTGYLRSVIRRDARAAGILPALDPTPAPATPPAPAPAPAPTSSTRTPARRGKRAGR